MGSFMIANKYVRRMRLSIINRRSLYRLLIGFINRALLLNYRELEIRYRILLILICLILLFDQSKLINMYVVCNISELTVMPLGNSHALSNSNIPFSHSAIFADTINNIIPCISFSKPECRYALSVTFKICTFFNFTYIPYFDNRIISAWHNSSIIIGKFDHPDRWFMPTDNIDFGSVAACAVINISNFYLNLNAINTVRSLEQVKIDFYERDQAKQYIDFVCNWGIYTIGAI